MRASLGRLLDSKVAYKLWYINPYALGCTLHNVWFSVNAAKSRDRERLEDYIRNSPQVVFFVEIASRYQYAATLQTPSLAELARFLEELSTKFGACFAEKSVATVLTLRDLPLVKRWHPPGTRQVITIGVDSNIVPIDGIGQAILDELTHNPMVSLNQIARSLGKPLSTIQYRYNQLQEAGVITGCRYFIDFLKLGYSFSYHQITLAGASKADLQALTRFLEGHPAVYVYSRCIGAWDMEIGTVTKEHALQTAFMRDLSDAFGPSLARAEIGFVTRFLKLNGVVIPA